MSSIERYHSINRFLRNSVDRLRDAVFVLEGNNATPLGPRFVHVNRTAEKITGYPPDSLLGQPLGMIFEPELLQLVLDKLPLLSREIPAFWVEQPVVKKDGSRKKHHWTFAAELGEKDQTLAYTIILRCEEPGSSNSTPHTVTDKVEDALESSRSEALARAAGGVAHDFKNMLQTITSTLSMLRLASTTSKEAHSFISDAELAIQQADTLAKQMMAFTKGQKSDLHEISLRDMLNHVSKISTLGTEVRTTLSLPHELRSVKCDAKQISQVLQNIIINGCQAMPNGGTIQITARNVDIPANNKLDLEKGPYAAVGIKDRGCGISEEDLSRIFEPYFTTKETGTGIGLATCREIIESHRGRIVVESTVGVGTEFIIFLPSYNESGKNRDRSTDTSVDYGTRPEAQETNRIVHGSGRILVVDDEDSVSRAVEGLLNHLGYKTTTASNGADAIELYKFHSDTSEPFDAVLLDMTLPGGLSGQEVMSEIRSVDDDARIIATSGYFDETCIDTLLDEGWAGVLPKPFPIEDLSQTVATVMEN